MTLPPLAPDRTPDHFWRFVLLRILVQHVRTTPAGSTPGGENPALPPPPPWTPDLPLRRFRLSAIPRHANPNVRLLAALLRPPGSPPLPPEDAALFTPPPGGEIAPNLLIPDPPLTPPEALLNLVLYRTLDAPRTWLSCVGPQRLTLSPTTYTLEWPDLHALHERLTARRLDPSATIFGRTNVTFGWAPGTHKHERWLHFLSREILPRAPGWAARLATLTPAPTLGEAAYDLVQEARGLGYYLGWQVAQDIPPHLLPASSPSPAALGDTWLQPGPGCLEGLHAAGLTSEPPKRRQLTPLTEPPEVQEARKLVTSLHATQAPALTLAAEQLLKLYPDAAETTLSALPSFTPPYLTLSDVEHALCEFWKYSRARETGRGELFPAGDPSLTSDPTRDPLTGRKKSSASRSASGLPPAHLRPGTPTYRLNHLEAALRATQETLNVVLEHLHATGATPELGYSLPEPLEVLPPTPTTWKPPPPVEPPAAGQPASRPSTQLTREDDPRLAGPDFDPPDPESEEAWEEHLEIPETIEMPDADDDDFTEKLTEALTRPLDDPPDSSGEVPF